MPRLTSFSDDTTEHADEPGNEWKVCSTPRFLFRRTEARRDERVVGIGYRAKPNCQISVSIFGVSQFLQQHDARMSVDGDVIKFSILSTGAAELQMKPAIGTARLVKARLEIVLDGIGRAVYRNAWRDSDSAQNIIAFVNVTCEKPAYEDALVWLVGSLGRVWVTGSNTYSY
jgi:hypothetical protein